MPQDPNSDSKLTHLNADTDSSVTAIHHTLGAGPTQASPGSHRHDGTDSYRISATDIDGDIAAANGLPAGGLADQVLTKIDGTDYNVEWSDATAITTTANLIKHYVKNDSGTTLAKGTVVYVSGANGTNILVKPALATSDATTATTLGFLAQSLTNNAFGYVVSEGLLTGLNTSAGSAGDPIWLSGTTAGGVIYGLANEPHAPVHIVYLGTVTRSNSNNGEIFVKVNNGWELQELHNVSALTPSNGDLLKYDSATSLWKNSAQSTLAIAPSQVTGTAVITSDSRLSDARTPTAHASTHASGGSDAITIAPAQVTGTAVVTADSRLSDARTPTAHASTHASGGSDAITVAQSQVTGLTTALSGKASTTHSATHSDGGSDPVYIEQAQVTGLTTALSGKASTSHAATHAIGGGDSINIAQSQVSGLVTALDGKASSTHVHGNISNTGTITTSVTATDPVKVVITNSSNTVGTLTTTGASSSTFLRGDGTWSSTPAATIKVAANRTTTAGGTALAANAQETATTVTYPSGRFSVTPSVVAATSSVRYIAAITSSSSTGFTMIVRNVSDATGTTYTWNYQAIEIIAGMGS